MRALLIVLFTAHAQDELLAGRLPIEQQTLIPWNAQCGNLPADVACSAAAGTIK